jgi:hypothetical protein
MSSFWIGFAVGMSATVSITAIALVAWDEWTTG